jgi:regulator of sirC expression with transglutaminase-like and TPR domain
MGKNFRMRIQAAARLSGERSRMRRAPMLISAVIAAVITSLGFMAAHRQREARNQPEPVVTPQTSDAGVLIDSLLEIPRVPANSEIGFLNLATAPGLPPQERSGIIEDGLKTLNIWAAAVTEQTFKNHHRYLKNPGEYKNEAEWKMAMLRTVIGQDFNVRYDPARTATEQQFASDEMFFSNPNSVFLTGCLGEARIGTCASLPVLYVAIGRRCGYPMHLVAAKGHLFARWDDGKGTRVNMEAANSAGFTSHPDAHYRTWPAPLTPQEEKSGRYLQNLTAEESLAIFMSTRAACLRSAGKHADAISAAAAAFRLAPNLGGIADTLKAMVDRDQHTEMVALQHQQELLRLRQMYDPMDPTPRNPMPGIPGHYPPAYPPSAFPQTTPGFNPGIHPQINPYAPR